MQKFVIRRNAAHRASGNRRQALIGVVASGNLEILVERVLEGAQCEVLVNTSADGFDEIWSAVVDDFVERYSPGGLRFSINDSGARPDTVSLRLAQGTHLMTEPIQ